MPDFLGQYYGVDWLAMVLTFVSLVLLGRRRKVGFLFGLGANAAWMAFGILAGSVANMVANVIFVALNVRGYVLWSRKDARGEGSATDDSIDPAHESTL